MRFSITFVQFVPLAKAYFSNITPNRTVFKSKSYFFYGFRIFFTARVDKYAVRLITNEISLLFADSFALRQQLADLLNRQRVKKTAGALHARVLRPLLGVAPV